MDQKTNNAAIEQSKLLYSALIKNGISAESEYYDGYKRVDIIIPSAKIVIEVDGPYHSTNPKQIEADFKRSHYSDLKKGFDTMHISNLVIEKYLDKIVNAIIEVVRGRVG